MDMNIQLPTVLDRGPRDIAVFVPEKTRERLAELDGDIVKWRALKDWPKLGEAVDAKLAEQAAFVANWDARVGPQGRHVALAGHDLSARDAADLWGFSKQSVSRWRAWLDEMPTYRARLILGTLRAAGLEPEANHRAMGTGENEWFTPAQYIIAARAVMGGIDLDPASHEAAQEVVQASHYFTKAEDALRQAWFGRVWLNPPYGRDDIQPFIDKMLSELAAGRVTEAILLTHNYTDTAWFQSAAMQASAICFPKGRIKFITIDGKLSKPTQGQAFCYYGDNTDDFGRVFDYGIVVARLP